MGAIGDFMAAIGQLGDPRFRRVLLRGVALTLGLLIVTYALFLVALDWLLPETMRLPLIGEVSWVDDVVSGTSIVLLLLLSGVLMVPVTSAFTGLFLEEVTDAVEARHYPGAGQAPRLGFWEGLADSARYMGVLIVANLLALAAYLLLAPATPLIFLALNAYLLSREYFQLIVRRRHGRDEARRLRRRHALSVWAAGLVVALPLFIPVLNLLVPIVGAATFTHLYHRLLGQPTSRDPYARTSRGRAR